MYRIIALVLITAVLGPISSACAESSVGKSVEDFTLPDYLGTKHSLSEWGAKRAVVVVFLGTECPLAKLYANRLVDLATRYEDQSVQIVGINANSHDTLLEIGHYARVHKINFPLLKDVGNRVADQFGAERTPEAFLLDEQRVVRYHGRIDDQYGVGFTRPNVSRQDLAVAIAELLAGQEISQPTVEAVGCHIGRVNRAEPTGDITYSNQIVRLLQTHCVRCHRSGQIAPFALTRYDEVIGWAETIREVIDDGRMPPWHADPKHGQFANDARMTNAEKEVFHQWVKNGMPRGDDAQLPEPVQYDEGWQIGKPDVVFKMPEPFTVPAKGVVPYQYFYLDTNLEQDVWVKASEVRPGNRSVVHHVFLFYLPPGQENPNAEDPLYNTIATYVPGVPTGSPEDGLARFVPAGSRLVFQLHYTPTGSEQIDQTEVGLIFADPNEVTKEAKIQAAINVDFTIPPGEENCEVVANYAFTQNRFVYALSPHMHYRGRSFRFTAKYPNGSQEVLLDVPNYDFNWQNAYVFEKPKLMPEGASIMCQAVFDNSEQNLVNPDPTAEVRWGDQSWDEMMLGIFVTSHGPNVHRGEFPKVKRLSEKHFEVSFRYRGNLTTKSVTVAGTFNDWNKDRHPMNGPDKEGYFHLTIPMKPGQQEYKFVVDGEQWVHDTENPDRKGPFNNSVVRVRDQNASRPRSTTTLPLSETAK